MKLYAKSIEFSDVFRLKPITDAHIGARACEEKRLKKDIQSIIDDPTCYCILGGDQIEAITRQDLRRFQASSIKESMLWELDSLLNAQLRDAVEIFKPLADTGRLIGAMRGNHEEAVKKHYSFDIHREFCEKLNVVDLGLSCMIRLSLNKGTGRRNLIIHAHHGHGGSGRMTGASINRMEQMVGELDFDVLIMGHNHKNHVSKRTRLSMTSNGTPRLIEKEVVLMRCGTYYKTYQEGDTTYGETAGYAPVKVGSPPMLEVDICGQYKELTMTVTQ
jgi:predicted phosphodiesterase